METLQVQGSTLDKTVRQKEDRGGLTFGTGLRLGYARVSTKDQVTDRQLDALEASGVDRLFVDHGVSGTVKDRPELTRLMDQLREGDVVVVHSLDRLGRRAAHLLTLIDEIHEIGASLRVLTLDVDSRSIMGKLMLGIVASLAEVDREQISERTKQGIAAARKRGRQPGRPRALDASQVQAASQLVDSGSSYREVAGILGVSERTIRRAIAG